MEASKNFYDLGNNNKKIQLTKSVNVFDAKDSITQKVNQYNISKSIADKEYETLEYS